MNLFENLRKFEESDNLICPRCGSKTLNPDKVMNALSRHRDTYVCSGCGTDEALNDYFGLSDCEWYEDTLEKKTESYDVVIQSGGGTTATLLSFNNEKDAIEFANDMDWQYVDKNNFAWNVDVVKSTANSDAKTESNQTQKWYAVIENREDTEHGNGSFDYDEAVKMANDYGYKYIAVIDPKDDFCLDIIEL